MAPTPILLIGAGGHAVSCIDVIEQDGRYIVAGLIASATEIGRRLFEYSVIGLDQDLQAFVAHYPRALIAVGQINDPEPRIRLFERIQSLGYETPTIVSPRAYVSPHARVGFGSIIMHGAVINAGAQIGNNCIINSQSLVEHDAVVGDHCHIATAAVVNGGVRIGAGTFIGSGSKVREGVTIGERCLVGMGQRVLAHCEAGTRMPRKKTS